MPTEKLRQALEETNVDGVERDVIDVLVGMFDLPEHVVARVVHAMQSVQHPMLNHVAPARIETLVPSIELRRAIGKQVNDGVKRAHLRRMQLSGQRVKVDTIALIPDNDTSKVCEGCRWGMTCMVDMLSTPDKCVENLKLRQTVHVSTTQAVTVLKVTPQGRIVVRADQPSGQHELSVDDVQL